MAGEALLRPSEQAWEGALNNLIQRFAHLDAAVVVDTLRKNDGHAGRTAQALRKLAPAEAVSATKLEVTCSQANVPATVTVAPRRDEPAPRKEVPVKVTPKSEAPVKVTRAKEAVKVAPKTPPEPAEATAAETLPPAVVAAPESLPATPVDSKLLFVAALQGDIQQLNDLVGARADLNTRYTGRPGEKADKIIDATPLHLVVTMGRADVAEALLKHGADVEAKMCRALGTGKPPEERYAEMTPLHLAAMEGHTNIVEMLIAFGADKNARMQLTEQQQGNANQRSITPLEIAHEMVSKGHTRESVTALLSK